MTKTMEKYPWLLAYDLATKRVVGYAYAGIFKDRAAYRSVPPPLLCLDLTIKGPCRRWSVESSIYISSSYSRRGIATKLYDALFTLLRVMNIINVIAVIALPNDKSVQLHEKYSFRTVGVFSKIGYKHESWIDVVYMEKSLQEPRYLSLENPEKIYANKAGEGEEEGEEREMMEPVFYPDCAHQLAEVLRAMEFSQSSS
jgi:L-amino acid N-acyltransferase YncA